MKLKNGIVLLFGVFLLISACRKASDPAAEMNMAQIPLTEQIETLDPAAAYDVISGTIVYQVYEQLYEYHYLKRPYILQPLLAEDLPEVSEDGLTYTIKIKKGVFYHDHEIFNGQKREVKSQDFITQIKRIAYLPTRSNGWFLFKDRIPGLDEFREKAKTMSDFESMKIKGLQTPDDYTLVIKLSDPYPQLKYVLAMSFTSPMPIEAVKAFDNNLNEKMFGTGPYELKKWNRGLNVIIERNKHYRGGVYPSQGDRFAYQYDLLKDANKPIPFLDRVEFKIIKESQTQWLNFLNKKVDFLGIPKDNFDTAINVQGKLSKELKDENIQLQVVPTLTYWWVAFNMTHPILGTNVKLRKAIAHAINVKKYIELFTNNVGQKANSIFVPGIPGYDPKAEVSFEYNIEKAKKLLAEAGFPGGKGLPEFTYDVRGSSTISRQQGEYIKNELGKIGVKLNVVVNTFPGFLEKLRKGQVQIYLDGWALDFPDAENISQLLYSKSHPPGPNHSFYNNPEMDALIDKLKFLPDGEEKFQLMTKMNEIVNEDMPWVLLFYKRDYVLYHDHLKNFRRSGLINNYIKYLKVDK